MHIDAELRSGKVTLKCARTLAEKIGQIIVGQAPHQAAANLLLDKLKRFLFTSQRIDWTQRWSIEEFANVLSGLRLNYERMVKQCENKCLDRLKGTCPELCGTHHPIDRISADLNLNLINRLRVDKKSLPFSVLKGLEDLNKSDLSAKALSNILLVMKQYAATREPSVTGQEEAARKGKGNTEKGLQVRKRPSSGNPSPINEEPNINKQVMSGG